MTETIEEYARDLPYRDVIVGPPYGEHTINKGLPRPDMRLLEVTPQVAREVERLMAREDGHDPGDEDAG